MKRRQAILGVLSATAGIMQGTKAQAQTMSGLTLDDSWRQPMSITLSLGIGPKQISRFDIFFGDEKVTLSAKEIFEALKEKP